jgi:hypothetical protein
MINHLNISLFISRIINNTYNKNNNNVELNTKLQNNSNQKGLSYLAIGIKHVIRSIFI